MRTKFAEARSSLVSKLPLVGLLLLTLTSGCDSSLTGPVARAHEPPTPGANRGTLSLRFGVYQTDKPSEMYRKCEPITRPLSNALSERLDRPVSIELIILGSYQEGLDAIVKGTVDFMRVGPATYLLAREKNPGIELLAMEKQGGKRFEGVIVVDRDSPVRELKDLRGRSFAFGDRNSTIGRYLAQDELIKAGIRASDLSGYDYLDRHDKVAAAVAIGDFDAGAIKISTFRRDKSGRLRVLKAFSKATRPWIGSDHLSADVVKALRASLTGLKDPTALEALRVSGLTEATEEDYRLVREAMERARAFTPIPESGQKAETSTEGRG